MTRDEMIEKLEGAHKAMTDAVQRQWSGRPALDLSIPARPDHDTDFLVCDPIREVLAALRAPAVTGEAARLLRELVTLVRGECPSLLNDDSGGDARLSLAIDAALAAPPAAGAPPALVALVTKWQEARKPATLSAPGEFLAETFQAAVRRMSAADEALAAYQLDGPAGGALVGQTAPTESTGPYLCACTCGCGDRTIRPGRCMVCRVRESCLKNEWTCEACAAGYRLAADGMHYDHDDSTWGVCRKVVASFRREEP